MKHHDLKSIWNVVKYTRSLLLTEFSENTQCSTINPSLLSDNIIQNHIEQVSETLNVTVVSDSLANVTNKALEAAAEMFIYLNFCPPTLLHLYKKLFKSEKPKKILLAMTSILKRSDSVSKESSHKIWAKLKDFLPTLYSQDDDKIVKNCNLKRTVDDSTCGKYRSTIGFKCKFYFPVFIKCLFFRVQAIC